MLPPAKHPHPKWLADAIFYEIYPQSFVDSNGDGIGDIPGITLKLDYIKDLGCNAIWLNPCFDSPFKDAGYDVRDYKKVASRVVPPQLQGRTKQLFRPLHLDRLMDLRWRRTAIHRRRIAPQRYLHLELLQMPAGAQLRFRAPRT